MHGERESVVVQHCPVGLVALELESVDGDALQRPTAALDAHVGGRDVPATVVDGHPECLTLAGHRHAGEHHHEQWITQSVVDPSGAEHGVLHLGDERLVGLREWLVPVRERNLEDRASGVDEVDLHADATIGVVEAGTSRSPSESAAPGGPHRWRRRPLGDELVLGRREGRSVEQRHGEPTVEHSHQRPAPVNVAPPRRMTFTFPLMCQ